MNNPHRVLYAPAVISLLESELDKCKLMPVDDTSDDRAISTFKVKIQVFVHLYPGIHISDQVFFHLHRPNTCGMNPVGSHNLVNVPNIAMSAIQKMQRIVTYNGAEKP